MKLLYTWCDIDASTLFGIEVGAVPLRQYTVTCLQRLCTAFVHGRPVGRWVHGRGEFIELVRRWEDRGVAFTSKVVQR